MPEDYYSLLGVDPDASADAILAAYRERAAEHHPDVSDDPGADETFRRLNRAKEVLTDEERRREYDRLGHDRFVDRRAGGIDQSARREPPRSTVGAGRHRASRPAGVPPIPETVLGAVLGGWPRGASRGDEGDAFAVDLESLFRKAGAHRRTSRESRPGEPTSGAEPGRRTCPKCHGRGTFVHDIDTARGRTRRLEPCERCRGAGTVGS